jgi:hypothetical protein
MNMPQLMYDIGLDDAEDVLFAAGDVAIIESTCQHQRQLILNNKGDFKQNPTIGAGVFTFLDDENYFALTRAIAVEFARDGMEVVSVTLSKGGKVISDAFYK